MLLLGDDKKRLVVSVIEGLKGSMKTEEVPMDLEAAKMAVGDKMLKAIESKDPKALFSAMKDAIMICESMEDEGEPKEEGY